MNVSDQFLLHLLAGGPPLSGAEARGVQRWWEEERGDEEGLLEFLVRHDVLNREATHLVEWMRRGLLTCTDGEPLFAADGVQRARNWLRASAGPVESTLHLSEPPKAESERLLASTALRPILQLAEGPMSLARPPRTGGARPLQAGALLGKCLLTAEIGRGSMGVVFRAYHQALRIDVAVKVLDRAAIDDDPSIYERFRLEARLLAQLNHPHVVRVHDFDDAADQPYIVLEWVEGLTLLELIQQSGRIRWDRAARVILQIAQGLEAAYKLGVVHRDVKPANVLITRDGNAKLADLGLAVIVDDDARTPIVPGQGLETMAGTVAYMAPEQAAAAARVTHRSDIYSLGCTLYHAITGQMPFQGQTRAEVLGKHASEQPTSPQRLVPDLDGDVLPILDRMMAKNPGDRYGSYGELVQALTQLLAKAGPCSTSAPPSPVELALSASPGTFELPRNLWRNLVARFKP